MAFDKITSLPYAGWVEPLDERQIVLSTRLRLARNISRRPVPDCLTDAEAEALAGDVIAALPDEQQWHILHINELLQAEKGVLLEKHLVSRDLLVHPAGRVLAVNDEQTLALMINEEDHLRLQVILPGLQPEEGWRQVSRLDDRLAARLDIAFDQRLGFLTACPSNLGTGLRVSVMLHLPALVMTGRLDEIFRRLPQAGLTVRGVYGEGSQSQSGLYQISNQITLGCSEEDIIGRLRQLVEAVIAHEVQAREWLLQNRRLWLEDAVGRAVGVLANAHLLSGQEAMEQISLVRLGVALGLCRRISYRELNLLMLSCQTPLLLAAAQRELTAEERDAARAAMARRYFGADACG